MRIKRKLVTSFVSLLTKSHEDWQVLQARNAVKLWGHLFSDGGYEKKPCSLCRALHFVQKSEYRRMYPRETKSHFCRSERLECKANGAQKPERTDST